MKVGHQVSTDSEFMIHIFEGVFFLSNNIEGVDPVDFKIDNILY